MDFANKTHLCGSMLALGEIISFRGTHHWFYLLYVCYFFYWISDKHYHLTIKRLGACFYNLLFSTFFRVNIDLGPSDTVLTIFTLLHQTN